MNESSENVRTQAEESRRSIDEAPLLIYAVFFALVPMFGFIAFSMYFESGFDLFFRFVFCGVTTLFFLIFYGMLFGGVEVKWLFINSFLGIVGIYSQMDWLMSLLGKTMDDYPWYIHIFPMCSYVMFTFIVWQAVLDSFRARDNKTRKERVGGGYVVATLLVYGVSGFFHNA